ncbi:MAG TPA: DUF5678 domain-containing protein [Pyrinomonadaceae bacterium]|jgi:hypothetical protein
MIQTAEQIIENLRALPISEQERFFDLAEEEKRKVLSKKEARKAESKDEQRKFQLALKWLGENREKYLGQWVCLDGDQLIAHGTDAVKLYQEAREKGVTIPFVEHIVEEKEAYGGGIEACR